MRLSKTQIDHTCPENRCTCRKSKSNKEQHRDPRRGLLFTVCITSLFRRPHHACRSVRSQNLWSQAPLFIELFSLQLQSRACSRLVIKAAAILRTPPENPGIASATPDVQALCAASMSSAACTRTKRYSPLALAIDWVTLACPTLQCKWAFANWMCMQAT